MVAGHDHQGLQHHAGVAPGLYQRQHVLQAGLSLHGADEVVLFAHLGEDALHLGVDAVGVGLSAVAHEDDGGLAVVVLGGGLRDGLGYDGEIGVGVQDGTADDDGLEGVGIGLDLVDHVVVLKAGHQVGGLDDQGGDPVLHGPIQGLGDVVDDFVVPAEHMVDDDLAGEAPAHVDAGEGFDHSGLNGADGLPAAVVEAGAEGDDQELVLTDAVLVQGIVQGGVAGVVVFFFLFFLTTDGRGRVCGFGRLRRLGCLRGRRRLGGRGGLRAVAAGQKTEQQDQRAEDTERFLHDVPPPSSLHKK